MERQRLDILEYESTYLELRPRRERLSDTTDASLLAHRRADMHADDAVASYGSPPLTAPSRRRAIVQLRLHAWPSPHDR